MFLAWIRITVPIKNRKTLFIFIPVRVQAKERVDVKSFRIFNKRFDGVSWKYYVIDNWSVEVDSQTLTQLVKHAQMDVAAFLVREIQSRSFRRDIVLASFLYCVVPPFFLSFPIFFFHVPCTVYRRLKL